MRNLIVTTLVAASTLAAASMDWKSDFAKHWAKSVALTEAVAEAMPADGYDFVPPSTVEPKEMSFGELMVHITQADVNAFARVTGMTGPAKPATTDKAAVTKYMKDGLDFCTRALASMTDDQMTKMVGPEGKQMSGQEVLWAYFTHTAHHRGQAEVYLRLKGIKPPTYTF
ncbi:MAG: DinB family protein [Acidobacteriota bacterium]|nr:DinB family protein [Acidobacteriota bacterium]